MEPKKAIFWVIFFTLTSFVATAQDEMFKVLASKGENKVSSSGGAWTTMTIGKKLHKNDKIVVAANGYLGLAHSCGKTIEIKKAGTYEVGKLASEVAAQNQGVCKKYVDFVVGEMTTQEEDMSKNKHKYMAVTGSVERGFGVKSFIPNNATVLPKKVILHWLPDTVVTDPVYVVQVMDMFNEVKYTTKTKNTFAEVDLGSIKAPEDQVVLWTVIVEDREMNTVDPRSLNLLPAEQSAPILAELDSISTEISEESALNNFVMASYYARKDLLVDAISCYEKAIALAPDVEDYRIAYNKFLIEKGLAESAEKRKQKKSK